MATPSTIADALDVAARNPKVASTDKGRVESHDIKSLMEALQHESAQTAAAKNHLGLRFVRLEAPGGG